MRPFLRSKKIYMVSAGLAVAFLLSIHSASADTVPAFSVDTKPYGTADAGDTVVVTVTPVNFTASTTYFEWFVQNGATPVASGYNLAVYSFKAPLMLAPYIIKVRVNPGTGFETKEDGTALLITPPNKTNTNIITPDGSLNWGAVISDFQLIAEPSQPSPGEAVTVTVDTHSFDKDRSSKKRNHTGH
ncbi:MAG: hypothetical protein HYW88_01025 [Candidatus Sungbacteria bacterium]|nr:hypothetical protein [Candidatus Sungbacteria bacterium]